LLICAGVDVGNVLVGGGGLWGVFSSIQE